MSQGAFRFTSRICAHLYIVYVTYTINERVHMRETERTYRKEKYSQDTALGLGNSTRLARVLSKKL